MIDGSKKPPKFAEQMLAFLLRRDFHNPVMGDFEEFYSEIAENEGTGKANVWYLLQILRSLPGFLFGTAYWATAMFRNYMIVTFRNFKRHKIYSAINLSGLAIGMACCILIFLYVRHEMSYDKYHENADRIYRVVKEDFFRGKKVVSAGSPDLLGPALKMRIPEVTNFVRFYHPFWVDKWLISYEDKSFYEKGLFFADSTVFDVFSFSLVRGNSGDALKNPNSAVLTKETAYKYFGSEDPIGKTLTIDNKFEVKVTGITKNVPENSHFRYDLLVSFDVIPHKWALNTWRTDNFYNYVLLKDNVSKLETEKKISELVSSFDRDDRVNIYLQSIKDIYLHSRHIRYDVAQNKSDAAYVYVFSAIAFFILIIACINYMNLTTARSVKRAREVGVRKVIGAYKSQLVKQFLGESIILSFFALVIALVLVMIFISVFGNLMNIDRAFVRDYALKILPVLIGITLFVGFVSGSYPALILSGFNPVKIFKGEITGGVKSDSFRKILVVSQFVISIILIIGTLIIYHQNRYCISKNPGFDKERILIVPLRDSQSKSNYADFKTRLLRNPEIKNVSGSSTIFGKNIGNRGIKPENNEWLPRNSMFVDYGFIDTYGIKLKEGRNFSQEYSTDFNDAYIINEAAAEEFNWGSGIGKKIIWAGDKSKEGYVIGVTEDFNYKTFHQVIEPVVLMLGSSGGYRYVSVKLKSEDITGTLGFIKNQWQALNPEVPFSYFFFDGSYDRLYKSEKILAQVFLSFTVLALFISCLGLLGLSAFMVESRQKEIGIRKVCGASTSKISLVFIKDFVKWILISNVIAWPIAYYLMYKWLQNFAYRINISIDVFIISVGLSLTVAIFTVLYQSVKAGLTNPVDVIRYE